MSISFFPIVGDQLTRIACDCGSAVSDTLYASQREAYEAFYVNYTATRPICGDMYCDAYLMRVSFVAMDQAPELNVSNVNAVELLDMLGYMVGEPFEERSCGQLTAEEFAGCVLVADGLSVEDPGVPAVVEGNSVFCGRAPGYLNTRITDLRKLSEYALEHSYMVAWS